MKCLSTALLVLCACFPAFAQNPVSVDGELRAIDAQLIPTSATDILTKTVNVFGIALTNEGASGTTCIVVDKQGTPRSLLGSAAAPLSIASGTSYVVSYGFRRRALGGITWSCAANTVTGYILYELPH
jgi:hypothetical protein